MRLNLNNQFADRFYTAVAYGTLVVDAYLALVCAATKAAPPDVYHFLPPFTWVAVSVSSRFCVLLVATWTAIMALGCLRAHGGHRTIAVLWFLIVIGLIWILLFVPLVLRTAWDAFVWGLIQ